MKAGEHQECDQVSTVPGEPENTYLKGVQWWLILIMATLILCASDVLLSHDFGCLTQAVMVLGVLQWFFVVPPMIYFAFKRQGAGGLDPDDLSVHAGVLGSLVPACAAVPKAVRLTCYANCDRKGSFGPRARQGRKRREKILD